MTAPAIPTARETSGLKRLTKTVLGRLGYEIRRKKGPRDAPGFQASYLTRLCQPRTVIDVGVGSGTWFLYEAFPRARFLLVEPVRHHRAAMERIAGEYDCELIYKAVGEAAGIQEMVVDTGDPEKSSFSGRTRLTAAGRPLERHRVEVTTLDTIFEEHPEMETPILLKIDAEGNELSALRGATSLLRATDTVIAEVSIAERFEGGYEFEDLVLFMRERGFRLFSFLDVTHKRNELRPRFADVAFKRRTEPV